MSIKTADLEPPLSKPLPPEGSAAGPLRERNGNGHGIWAVIGRLGGAALAFLSHALLTRLLTKTEYGQYVLILSAVTFLSIVARCGLSRTLVRFIAEGFAIGDRDRVKTAIRLGAITLVGSLVVCAAVAPPLLWLLGRYFVAVPSDPGTIVVILVGVFFVSLLQFIAEVFRGMHDQKNAAMFDGQSSKPLANGLFLAAVLVAACFVTLGATSSMALQVVVIAALCLLGALHLRESLPKINSLTPVEGHHGLPPLTETLFLATCVPLLITEVVGFLSNQGDVWIVGATLTESQVANFGAARRFVMAISMPLMAINLMVLPSIPQLYVQRRTADLQRLLQRNATSALVPALLVLLITLCGPGALLSLLYGSDYSGAGTCLVILCAGQVFHMFTGSCGQLLMLTGRERLVLALYVVAGILLFTIGPIAAIRYGLNGVAIVSTSILVFENLVLWILDRVLLGVWTHASPASLGDAFRELSRILNRRRPALAKTPPRIKAEDKLEVGEVLGNG